MLRLWCVVVVICVVGMGESVKAGVGGDVDAIADRYLAAMQRKRYGFLSNEELGRRRGEVAGFAEKFLRGPLDKGRRAAMLEAVDRCIDRLYPEVAGKVEYRNGFGSGGEEWVYLNDRDYFLMFEYHLWVGLTREKLSAAEVKRQDVQREWMRKYLTDLPFREGQESLPRVGMRHEDVRAWVLRELEKAFADPMHLLSEPMSEEGFGELQGRFKGFSNGTWSDFHDMEVAALTARFISHENAAGRYGRVYTGKLPFADTVVDLWGNGPSLCFASNADFRGSHGRVLPSGVYDVIRCVGMRTDPAPAAGSPAMNEWLTKEGRGELSLEDTELVAVRGAKIAALAVKDWFEADKLSDDQLRAVIRDGGRERISIKGLPPVNGTHSGNRTEGEFFIVVQNGENRLVVINLHNYEFKAVAFWCRPRALVAGKGK